MFRKAASRNDVGPGEVCGTQVEGKSIALYVIDGQLFATTDVCPHAQCLLSEDGVIDGADVECSCHGSRFDIRTGRNTNPPASEPLQTFPARVEGDDVLVDV